MTNARLVARFLRERAWWRLDTAGASALHAARSVISLYDAAAYLEGVPDDDPDIAALEAAGCFRGGVFEPGAEGRMIVREWQLADTASGGPAELLAELASAAVAAGPGADGPRPPATISIPRQDMPPHILSGEAGPHPAGRSSSDSAHHSGRDALGAVRAGFVQ